MEWSDVDLEERVLYIIRGRGRVQIGGSAEIHETPPKTRKGTRTLPLPDFLVATLKRVRKVQAEESGLRSAGEQLFGVIDSGQ